MSKTDLPLIATGKPTALRQWLKIGLRRFGIRVRWQARNANACDGTGATDEAAQGTSVRQRAGERNE